jgi:hypothetical protein
MRTIIFGNGYCGGYFKSILNGAACTELQQPTQAENIYFDFNNESTWKNLPDFDRCIITFKMNDPLKASAFSELLNSKRVIILSSARCLVNSSSNEVIDEKKPLNNSLRNQCESEFPQASILHLGLIWGPGREPQRWIKEKRIKNGNKLINLIHLEDIGNITKLFLKQDNLQGRFLISDGIKRTWSQLAKKYSLTLPTQNIGLESRGFNTDKLKSILPQNYCFVCP